MDRESAAFKFSNAIEKIRRGRRDIESGIADAEQAIFELGKNIDRMPAQVASEFNQNINAAKKSLLDLQQSLTPENVARLKRASDDL